MKVGRAIFQKSDVTFLVIAIWYLDQPLFGPALNKNKPSTTQPKQVFFWTKFSWPLFLQLHCSHAQFFSKPENVSWNYTRSGWRSRRWSKYFNFSKIEQVPSCNRNNMLTLLTIIATTLLFFETTTLSNIWCQNTLIAQATIKNSKCRYEIFA